MTMPIVRSTRGARRLALAAILSTLPYLLLVVLPYYVNDLDRLPLPEIASGLYDPKDMWPTTVPYVGGLMHLFGIFSIAFAPVALVLGFFAGVLCAWLCLARRPRAAGSAFAYAVIAVLCVLALVWFATPSAGYLAGWQLD